VGDPSESARDGLIALFGLRDGGVVDTGSMQSDYSIKGGSHAASTLSLCPQYPEPEVVVRDRLRVDAAAAAEYMRNRASDMTVRAALVEPWLPVNVTSGV